MRRRAVEADGSLNQNWLAITMRNFDWSFLAKWNFGGYVLRRKH